jgi:hypothetical protein
LLLLLSLLILGIEPAAAKFQATSTPTWQSLFQTQTSVPTRSYVCPTALPIGWGTVTPEAWWNMQCGNCNLQLTPTYALTTATATPSAPTATGTPATATPSPTATTTPEWEPIYLTFHEIVPVPLYPWGPGNTWPAGAYNPGSPGGGFVIPEEHRGFVIGLVLQAESSNGSGVAVISDDGVSDLVTVSWSGITVAYLPGLATWPTELRIAFTDEVIEELPYQYMEDNPSHAVVLENTRFWLEELAGSQFVYGKLMGGFGRDAQILRGYVTYSFVESEPEPQADFCAEVNDGQEPEEAFQLGVELPRFEVGPASCFGWEGAGVSVGEWDFTLPPMNLCLSPIRLGNLDLLGIVISMDLMVTVMGGVLVIRWAMRS